MVEELQYLVMFQATNKHTWPSFTFAHGFEFVQSS